MEWTEAPWRWAGILAISLIVQGGCADPPDDRQPPQSVLVYPSLRDGGTVGVLVATQGVPADDLHLDAFEQLAASISLRTWPGLARVAATSTIVMPEEDEFGNLVDDLEIRLTPRIPLQGGTWYAIFVSSQRPGGFQLDYFRSIPAGWAFPFQTSSQPGP